jgi:very-short-patch-repair endonuclease/ssDNA-binding Zn-finger/Zn-ribbon topoisomerase 1
MSKKFTQKEVLDRFKKVHGDEYDYSLVEYIGQGKKVIIVCRVHGDFTQVPVSHWSGRGCPKCAILKQRNTPKKRKTTASFIEEAMLVHSDEYDYSLVDYFGTKTKIKIICKKNGHGIFEQRPEEHLLGQGCKKCGHIKIRTSQLKSTEDFIKQAKEVHLDKNYGYERVNYKGHKKNIIVVCPLHGDFEQTADTHLQSGGCPECGKITKAEKLKLPIDDFFERSNLIHNNFYGYEKVEYVNSKTEIIIICPSHGEFLQIPERHMIGIGCKKCGVEKSADTRRKKNSEFIEEANLKHNGIYKYDNVDYKNDRLKVSITCKIHGEFLQAAGTHLRGVGCPRCFNKSEGRLAIILNEIGVVHRGYRINNRYFDFYLPEYNLIIERDGEQHYYKFIKNWGSIEQNHQIDIEKTNLAKSKGHKICRIPYWLSEEDERKEIQNIINGKPTYPDVPDLEQAKTKPLPN